MLCTHTVSHGCTIHTALPVKLTAHHHRHGVLGWWRRNWLPPFFFFLALKHSHTHFTTFWSHHPPSITYKHTTVTHCTHIYQNLIIIYIDMTAPLRLVGKNYFPPFIFFYTTHQFAALENTVQHYHYTLPDVLHLQRRAVYTVRFTDSPRPDICFTIYFNPFRRLSAGGKGGETVLISPACH